jgi:hypothetical protein
VRTRGESFIYAATGSKSAAAASRDKLEISRHAIFNPVAAYIKEKKRAERYRCLFILAFFLPAN